MAEQAAYLLLQLEPSLRFLHTFTNRSENYTWKYEGRRPLKCEIQFLQEGTLLETIGSSTRTYRQGTVRCFVDNVPRECMAEDGILHEFYLSFWLPVPPIPITEEAVAQWTVTTYQAILPDEVTDPVICRRIAALLMPTVGLHVSDGAGRELQLRACLYECLAILTQYAVDRAKTRQQLLQKQRSSYTIRACAYIEQHLHEKIRMEDIAAFSGVSYNYLKNLFPRDMGTSLLEYINRSKIRLVERYITVDGMTLEQACQAIGLQEPKYLSRLFRKCTGMSVREYRRIYAEHTEQSISSRTE